MVRFAVLQVLPKSVLVPDELLARLAQDPDEAVRTLASRRAKR